MSFKEKYRVVEQIQNHNGTLYKGDIVIFENKEPDGSYRVKDKSFIDDYFNRRLK